MATDMAGDAKIWSKCTEESDLEYTHKRINLLLVVEHSH